MSNFSKRSILAACVCLLASPSMAQQADEKPQQENQKSKQAEGRSAKAAPAKTQAKAEQQITGKVQEIRQIRAGTKGGEATNRIALLETAEGKRIAVDLGPDAKLKNVEMKRGTPITVTGTAVSIEGEPVFIVSSFRAGDKETKVRRPPPDQARRPKIQTFSGQIGQMREMDVKGADARHRVAVLEADKTGNKMLVDLGPKAQTEELNLEQGDKARVKGIAMNISDRRVLVAQSVQKDGKSVEIERQALPSPKKLRKR